MSKKLINLARMYTGIRTYDSNYTSRFPSPSLVRHKADIPSNMQKCLPKTQKLISKSLTLETLKNRYMKKNKKQLHEGCASY